MLNQIAAAVFGTAPRANFTIGGADGVDAGAAIGDRIAHAFAEPFFDIGSEIPHANRRGIAGMCIHGRFAGIAALVAAIAFVGEGEPFAKLIAPGVKPQLTRAWFNPRGVFPFSVAGQLLARPSAVRGCRNRSDVGHRDAFLSASRGKGHLASGKLRIAKIDQFAVLGDIKGPG